MHTDYQNFSSYIKALRHNNNISLRAAASELKITAAYLCDLENGKRPAPITLLEEMIELYGISDLDHFYDLVGKSRGEVPPDIAAYLMDNEDARTAIRRGMENEVDWKNIIKLIIKQTLNVNSCCRCS